VGIAEFPCNYVLPYFSDNPYTYNYFYTAEYGISVSNDNTDEKGLELP
jgi:hypothetical protein